MDYHQPVMLQESIQGLEINPAGIYVDLTFGGGGHSEAILDQLTTGKLIAFDQDKDAEANAKKFENRSFTFLSANFRHLQRFIKLLKIEQVNGVLGDFGVSSHQFEQPNRGFSIKFDAKLDMRMDQKNPLDAEKVLNEYSENELINLFSAYGEIRNAKKLVQAIAQTRINDRIDRVEKLKSLLSQLAPKHKEFKYYARVFQALRIEVNDELGAIKEVLEQSAEVIKPGGRLVVISYHSLEDRIVKNYIQKGNFAGDPEKDFYGNLIRPFEPVNRKPITPSKDEIALNNKARSGKLRIAKKL